MRPRTFAKVQDFSDSCAPDGKLNDATPCDEEHANLISSLLAPHEGIDPFSTSGDKHALTLDIDMEARLLPSSTPGHYHLFIDRVLSWEQYVVVLQALAFAGIIEDGYLRAALRQKQTYVRKPGVTK
jgi:hypothetical protein